MTLYFILILENRLSKLALTLIKQYVDLQTNVFLHTELDSAEYAGDLRHLLNDQTHIQPQLLKRDWSSHQGG